MSRRFAGQRTVNQEGRHVLRKGHSQVARPPSAPLHKEEQGEHNQNPTRWPPAGLLCGSVSPDWTPESPESPLLPRSADGRFTQSTCDRRERVWRRCAAPVWSRPFFLLGFTRLKCFNFNQLREKPRGGRVPTHALVVCCWTAPKHVSVGAGHLQKDWHPAFALPLFSPHFLYPPLLSSVAGRSDFLRARLLFLLPGSRQTFSLDLSLSLSVFSSPPSMRWLAAEADISIFLILVQRC